MAINQESVYVPSDEIVAREIEGEFIIVPLTNGSGDLETELYSLNETGREIWCRLDGRALSEIITELSNEFDSPRDEIAEDILGLVAELVKRHIVQMVE